MTTLRHNHAKRGQWTRTYTAWYSMRQRCNNPKTIGWKYYGGKGIQVCAAWDSFEVFLAEMGEAPSDKHSVDRIKNELGYFRSNCRWATKKEQDNNRTSNVRVSFQGREQNISQWAEELGIQYSTLYRRIRVHHWNVARAMTKPVRASP